MRPSTLAAVAVLTVSTAALAQVARAPVEQKNAPANAADPMGNEATANITPAGIAATPPDAKTEPATPPR